jgi:putative SOS response-associated peptidase YedK
MCGRYTRDYTWEQIYKMYMLIQQSPPSNMPPNFNVCPTQLVDVITGTAQGRSLSQMRWGLVPAWWQKAIKDIKLTTFNARAETVTTKPFFRWAWRRNRCLLPASGYYEWQTIGKEKQPWYFTRRDGEVVTTAGLWDEWTDRDTGEILRSCTMIITEPNNFVAEVHDRMPVILEPSQFDAWLSGEAGTEMLRPANDDVLQRVPVSKRINSSRTNGDDPSLTAPVPLGDPQGELL